jgi:soluble lytic murein transglycosylase
LGLICASVLAISVVGVLTHAGLPDAVTARLYPLAYREEIRSAGAVYGVDPYLLAAVARTESSFNPDVTSSAGAVGLMQLMPATADWIVSQDDWKGPAQPDLRQPADNAALGAYYLAFLLHKFEGNPAAALAAYNAGDTVVAGWVDRQRAAEGGQATLAVGDIPFPETRGFVQRVVKFESLYRSQLPHAFDAGATSGDVG